MGGIALDATCTTAAGLAIAGKNHGNFTWLAMPLEVRIRPLVVHLSATESARMDALLLGRNKQVLEGLLTANFVPELEFTDGDSGTSAFHRLQHVQQWEARLRLELLGVADEMGARLFDKMGLLRAAGAFDSVRWIADSNSLASDAARSDPRCWSCRGHQAGGSGDLSRDDH
jgi:hypothetical protein